MNRWRVGLAGGSSALLLGLAALFVGLALTRSLTPSGDSLFAWILVMAGSYFVAALPLALVWPRPSWRWGVWVMVPPITLVAVSVAFTGQIGVFLERDLITMTAVVGAAMLGGKVGELARRAWLPPADDSA